MEDNEEYSQKVNCTFPFCPNLIKKYIKNLHIEEESDEEDYESKIENQLNKKFFPPNIQNETKNNKNDKHLQILNEE